VVVLAPKVRTLEPPQPGDEMTAGGGDREEALWHTVTALLGERPQFLGGLWVWRVTPA
jgi:hypothetical protein